MFAEDTEKMNHVLLAGVQIGTSNLQSNLSVLKKVENTYFLRPSNCASILGTLVGINRRSRQTPSLQHCS